MILESITYIYIICGFMSFAAFTYLSSKAASMRTKLLLTDSENISLKAQNAKLLQENMNFTLQNREFEVKAEHLSSMIKSLESDKEKNTQSIKASLFDLGNELSKQLIEIHKNETKEARELSGKNIEETSKKFHGEFERLVSMIGSLSKDIEESKNCVDVIKQSLLSPIAAGKLAEITLENILKSSGLRPRLDFAMQYTIKNLNNNSLLRPDAVIFLPAKNLMVIDAKASKFLMQGAAEGSLSKTMNMHLKALNSKEYAQNTISSFYDKGENFNNIITLMFLPTEQAVEKIVESDNNFMEKAWGYNIFPVGPMGIMNMLSFAKFQICEAQRLENHNAILEEVKKIIKSIASITGYSERIGNSIQSLVNNYDKFAASFNHNFLSKVKNIQKLGIVQNEHTKCLLNRYHLISSKDEIVEYEEDKVSCD